MISPNDSAKDAPGLDYFHMSESVGGRGDHAGNGCMGDELGEGHPSTMPMLSEE